ncbi:ATP-dependent zinc protease [Candidatus Saccharibacteria bacterium]|nr:ATP-dependent zinc protease [Candidatus Saccharibacteria bacterium]
MMSTKNHNQLSIIGSTEFVDVSKIKNIPAKIDTGADTSSIWASDIDMEKDGTLVFSLFHQKSPFYTGERLKTKKYTAKSVRSSHGDKQIRYRVELPLSLGGKNFTTTFTLSNRSRNHFPILIGRRTLEGVFLVDVAKFSVARPKASSSSKLSEELKADPYKFHQKYISN